LKDSSGQLSIACPSKSSVLFDEVGSAVSCQLLVLPTVQAVLLLPDNLV